MMQRRVIERQRGAVLVVGMILLAVIMLMVAGSYMLGSTNLKSVGNQQFRNEAIASANAAIEHKIDTEFTQAASDDTIFMDLNKDDVNDYEVVIAAPQCVQATESEATEPSSLSLLPGIATSQTWNTVWDIKATVTDASSGTNVTVHSGVRVLLSKAEKENVCN